MSKLRIITVSAAFLIILIAGIFVSRNCYSAAYYKYIDKDGTVCFTDSRQSIPEEYKKKAIKITDENEHTEKESRDHQVKGDHGESPLSDKKQGAYSKEKIKDALTTITNSSLFMPAAAVTIFLVLFIAIGKIGGSLGHKQLSSVLRIALTVGLMVFLFYTHVEKMADFFTSLKKDVTDTAKRAEERNKQTEDAAKDQPRPGMAK